MTLIVIVALATLLTSFLCSVCEAALYAITPAQIELQKHNEVGGARLLARLRADVEEPIAAILTINTIAHTVGAAWCGAMVGRAYGSTLVGVFTAVFTVLVLVLTEIVPKSIGVRYANRMAPMLAWPILVMIWVAWPLAQPAKLAMRRLTGSGGETAAPTEDEVVVFSRLAAKHGELRPDEHRWVRNALLMDQKTARELMTPRTVVETLPDSAMVSEVTAHDFKWVHSRVPVIENDDLDAIVGMVYRRDVFDAAVQGRGDTRLRDLMRPIPMIPDNTPAHRVLDLFINQRRHMAALIDEYGGFSGVITLEDVLECFLGQEIVDEHDEFADLQEMARRRNLGKREGPVPSDG